MPGLLLCSRAASDAMVFQMQNNEDAIGNDGQEGKLKKHTNTKLILNP